MHALTSSIFLFIESLSSPLPLPTMPQNVNFRSHQTGPARDGMVAVISPTCGLRGWQWWQKAATLLQVKRRLTRLGQPAADIQSIGMEIAACTSFPSVVCNVGTDVIVCTPCQTLFRAPRVATHLTLRNKSLKQRVSPHCTREAGTG